MATVGGSNPSWRAMIVCKCAAQTIIAVALCSFHAPADQSGVVATLSRWRSRVRIPVGVRAVESWVL